MSNHIKQASPIQNLEFREPWKMLTEQEKNYAYFMTKASWAGAKIVPHQISYESPALFCVFQAYFADKDFQRLEECAIAAGVSKEEWKEFVAYVGGFYGNLSNYHSFGGMKFVPNMTPDKFSAILYSHPSIERPENFLKLYLDKLLP